MQGPGNSGSAGGKRPRLKQIRSVLGWGLFIALVIAIWPTTLGGATSYVIVKGHSMEETLFPGDFVVLRTGDYQIGDVVSYMPFDDIPAQVIHRILEFKDDGTIILQGDNNNFIDPFFPTREEITGKMLFHIPKIGSVAWFLGQPLVWGSLMLLAGAIYLYQPSRSKKAKRPRKTGGAEQTEDEEQVSEER